MSDAIRAALVVAMALLAGCVASPSPMNPRPLRPEPRQLAPAPPDARVDAVVVTVGQSPLDTNGNGYPDLLEATVHLFDRRYVPPIREDGAFVFVLYPTGRVGRPDAEPIRQWRIEADAVQRAMGVSGVGLCYRFRPSLLAGGRTDVLPISSADLVCYFEPTDGRQPVFAGDIATIQVGRRVLIPEVRWREITEEQAASEDGSPPDPAPEPDG